MIPSLKLQTMELPWKTQTLQKNPKIIILVPLTLILLALFQLCFPLQSYSPSFTNSSKPPQNDSKMEEICDVFSGEWVPNGEAPYYTNETCWAIHEHQNCMKYGRPDSEFMRWKWKPNGCEMPVFNPYQFLEIVRGKTMAFVGDSVGRNHMQSLICLLSRVEYPIDVSHTTDEYFKRWRYVNYNFTLVTYWAPFLVKSEQAHSDGPTHTGIFNLHLDEPNLDWTADLHRFHYLILGAGHWFFRPSLYYERRRLVGCRFCQIENVTDFPMTYGYRKAFRTAFNAINRSQNFTGVMFLRTFAPSHFEGGEWNEGGDCRRRRPFRNGDVILEGLNLDLYMTQLEEFRVAAREGKKKGLRYRLIDTTGAMLMRPDGHPSRYGHRADENVTLYNDCVHWCLPGPIDTWSDFLLHMLKVEGRRAFGELHGLKEGKKDH